MSEVVKFPQSTLFAAMDVLGQINKLKPKKGDTGVLKCPKCGGDFRWSYNGPRAQRGACSTPNCLSFMS